MKISSIRSAISIVTTIMKDTISAMNRMFLHKDQSHNPIMQHERYNYNKEIINQKWVNPKNKDAYMPMRVIHSGYAIQ